MGWEEDLDEQLANELDKEFNMSDNEQEKKTEQPLQARGPSTVMPESQDDPNRPGAQMMKPKEGVGEAMRRVDLQDQRAAKEAEARKLLAEIKAIDYELNDTPTHESPVEKVADGPTFHQGGVVSGRQSLVGEQTSESVVYADKMRADSGKVSEGLEKKGDEIQATKHDTGKVRNLFPIRAKHLANQVFTYGAEKYSPGNWHQGDGFDWDRLEDALDRHIESFRLGENIDPESGLSHLGHAMCCLAMLAEHYVMEHGLDTRGRNQMLESRAAAMKGRKL